jgi:DNA modification methylase
MEVAMAAVKSFSKSGQVVLDPMAGSGVVAHAAQLLGRLAIGRDIDPLAVLLARTLCLQRRPADFAQLGNRVLERAKVNLQRRKLIGARLRNLPDEDRKFVAYWFTTRAAREMLALTTAIDEIARGRTAEAFQVILSSLVISRESGASMAMDLSRSRPHRVSTKVPRLPFDAWTKKVAEFCRHFDNRPKPIGRADIQWGDARRLNVADESVDAVISSPPYVNAIDYIRASKFSLVFFGFDLASLRQIRSVSVGTEVGLKPGCLPDDLDRLVDTKVTDPHRRPMLRRYVQDMLTSLRETYRVLKPGAPALYVVGPSILSRRDYDGAEVLGRIARAAGYRVVGYARRDLSASNRSLPPPRRFALSESINQRMTCELYVVLNKE